MTKEQAVTKIPREELDRSHRRIQRLCGAAILQAMGETDTSFTQIAERLEVSEEHVREWLMGYADCTIDAESPERGLRIVSFIMSTMDCLIDLRIIESPAKKDASNVAKET